MLKKSFIALVFVALLGGCSSAVMEKGDKHVSAKRQEAEQSIATARQRQGNGFVTHSEESWIPLRKVDKALHNSLRYKADNTEVGFDQRFTNLAEIVNTVASKTGVPVSLSPDIPMYSATGIGGAGMAGAVPGSTPMPMGVPGMAGGPIPTVAGQVGGLNQQSTQITGASPYQASYNGPLSGFMNVVAAYYGLSWKAEANTLRFFYLDSRTFRIKALPGDTKLSSTVGSSSGSAGSTSTTTGAQSGSSANSTGVTFSGLSVWTGLQSSISQMLTPIVGKVFTSPATGTITVTDTPAVLERVANFIEQQNAGLSRQVAVNVRVLSVEISDTSDYGINWDVVYKSLGDTAGFALKTAFPTAQGAANIVFSVADPNGLSRWTGSSAMISALSTQGRVSELTSATLVTINNQPAPVNVGRKVSYLASSATSQTPNVGSTTTLTPGTVDTGFAMTLVPHIMDGSEILLQYSIDLSSLLKMNTITSGGASIQAPDVSTSNFIQRVRMMSGETLVVAGFDQDNLAAVANGVGSADNSLLGSRNGNTKRSMLVVLIQPVLSGI